ncbi:unnamed protein product [Brassica rapa subsp. narinosa]
MVVVIKAYSKRSGAVRTKKGNNKEMPIEYAARYFLVFFSIEQRDQWWMR